MCPVDQPTETSLELTPQADIGPAKDVGSALPGQAVEPALPLPEADLEPDVGPDAEQATDEFAWMLSSFFWRHVAGTDRQRLRQLVGKLPDLDAMAEDLLGNLSDAPGIHTRPFWERQGEAIPWGETHARRQPVRMASLALAQLLTINPRLALADGDLGGRFMELHMNGMQRAMQDKRQLSESGVEVFDHALFKFLRDVQDEQFLGLAGGLQLIVLGLTLNQQGPPSLRAGARLRAVRNVLRYRRDLHTLLGPRCYALFFELVRQVQRDTEQPDDDAAVERILATGQLGVDRSFYGSVLSSSSEYKIASLSGLLDGAGDSAPRGADYTVQVVLQRSLNELVATLDDNNSGVGYELPSIATVRSPADHPPSDTVGGTFTNGSWSNTLKVNFDLPLPNATRLFTGKDDRWTQVDWTQFYDYRITVSQDEIRFDYAFSAERQAQEVAANPDDPPRCLYARDQGYLSAKRRQGHPGQTVLTFRKLLWAAPPYERLNAYVASTLMWFVEDEILRQLYSGSDGHEQRLGAPGLPLPMPSVRLPQ